MEIPKYKFIAYSRNGFKEVFPKNGNTFAISYEKKDKRALFSKSLKGSMVFSGEDYHWLKYFEDSIYKCDTIELLIQKRCGNGYIDFFVAELALNKGKWNTDSCYVDIEATEVDKYSCYEAKKDKELNLFSYIFQREKIKLVSGTIETDSCADDYIEETETPFCEEYRDPELGWVRTRFYINRTRINNNTETLVTRRFEWARERITSTEPLPYPWISIGGNVYVKKPIVFNFQQRYDDPEPTVSIYEETWQLGTGLDFDNGMKLKSVFEVLIGQACEGLTLKSDFFQWNPSVSTSINYVTEETTQVNNLILFQRSDIKRPAVSGNASIATTTLEEILNDICKIFNLLWDIDTDTNKFIIEHESYFNKNVGLNLVGRYDSKLREGLNQYSYDLDNMPKRMTFQMPDNKNQYSYDFKGMPILYNNSCAGKGDKTDEDVVVENIITDVEHCLRNSSSDSSVVSDEGFVLIACDATNTIITEYPILDSEGTINNALSWAHIQEKYYKHNQPFKEINMNGTDQTAKSVRPTRKQVPLNVMLCCEESFNPDDKVITGLGEGIVQNATFNLYNDTLELELLFDATETNTNEPPVAVDDMAETFVNLAIDIDVLANDSDPEGNIDEDSINIVAVSGGTATVVDKKIRFVPTTDFVGQARIWYTIKDTYQEVSNQATVSITIKSGSPLPIANNDTFTIVENGTLNVGNVLDNDTGDGAIECIPETKSTPNGGNIQIFSNGSFIYQTPPNYVGNDPVQYTMKDSNNNTANGTVTFEIFAGSTVYASFDSTYDQQVIECDYDPSQEKIYGGNVRIEIYSVKFWADSAKTIPLDVTNYGIDVTINYVQTGDGAHNGSETINNVTGTSYETDIKIISFSSCPTDPNNNWSRTYSLATSPNYIIV